MCLHRKERDLGAPESVEELNLVRGVVLCVYRVSESVKASLEALTDGERKEAVPGDEVIKNQAMDICGPDRTDKIIGVSQDVVQLNRECPA